MPVIGFSKPSEADINIIKLFLSPIIFYITTTILKDHFASKIKDSKIENSAGENETKKKKKTIYPDQLKEKEEEAERDPGEKKKTQKGISNNKKIA
jgi:hypothetical protein